MRIVAAEVSPRGLEAYLDKCRESIEWIIEYEEDYPHLARILSTADGIRLSDKEPRTVVPFGMVTVPANMVGVTRAALESFFASLGLEPDISLHDSAFPENTVIYVAGVGQEVPVGTAIEVHISSGPAELPVESVTITFAGEVVTDFLGFVGVGTPLAVSIEPTNAAQGAEIIWESDNPNVVEITPDPGGLTATAMHMSPGWTTITVTVNGISGYVIARTQG